MLSIMELKLPLHFPFLSPDPTPHHPHPHRPSTEIHFSRWNNANAEKFNLRRRRQQQIEDDIRRLRRFTSATNIAHPQNDPSTPPNPNPPPFKSTGTPSSPSLPSIPGKNSKYSKPPPHPALKFSNIPFPKNTPTHPRPSNVNIGEDGVSYVIDGAPFEFKYSYTETPKVRPLKMREPPFVPFGPTTMPRPWTGRAPLPPSKKKMREFDSFVLPPPNKKGVKPVQKPGPFLPGTFPRYVHSREEILGEPLTQEEIHDMVNGCRKTSRQLNIGRDGLTHNMLENIHAHWKRRRVCKIKCKGVCTVDMNNVCEQLEERTGGKIIYRKGGVLYLFRGRNYNFKTRPRFPLMLWKPTPPVYPRLVQRVPEGLTLEEATEMRRKGRNLIPICKLGKNGVYCNLVRNVREAFEECELVRINCQGLNPSDFRRIGAKLRDLVPCVLLSFVNEHILMWRGQNWVSALPPLNDDTKKANKNGSDVKRSDTLPPDALEQCSSHEDRNADTLPPDALEQHSSHEDRNASVSQSLGDGNEQNVEVPYPAEDSNLSGSVSTDAASLVKRSDEVEVITTEFPGSLEETDTSTYCNTIPTSLDHNGFTSGDEEVIIHKDENEVMVNSKERNDDHLASTSASDTMIGTSGNSSKAKVDPAPCTKGVLELLGQAVERGSALILDDESFDADIVYRRSVALAKSAPPGPEFRLPHRKFVVQKSDTDKGKQENKSSETKEMIDSSMKDREKSIKIRRREDFDGQCLNVVPQGTLGVDELAKLLT